ncbi:DUF3114 domain-containing protein [Streptococcus salivarius]|uniref:DUF3114 domain-containing protein n=1 Tax=Streptococcus salivarius TaxID=1304 RepID=UPI0039C44889
MLIGSKAFRHLWEDWRRDYQPLQVLKLLLAYIGMPEDLSGELEETQHLLSYFDPDLAPHDSFWKDVVKLVDLAFPDDSLSKDVSIERQIHQLRYLISSQQAQYVRTHYKKSGMTDKEALAVYLRWKPFTMFDQGRLHQKISFCDGKGIYPDGIPSVNLKILLYNRVEFILDSQGNFLNEVDAEQVTESGVVNGASFNYGNFKRHWQLDVEPVQPHDPDFRNRMTKGFRSPNKLKKRWGQQAPEQFDKSFYNPKGIYAQSHRSLANDVKRQARFFLALVYGFKPNQTKQSKEVHMSKQPQNNKGTAVLGSLVFMALYALGIWHNAVRGNIPFLILWSVLLLVNVSYLIFRLRK